MNRSLSTTLSPTKTEARRSNGRRSSRTPKPNSTSFRRSRRGLRSSSILHVPEDNTLEKLVQVDVFLGCIRGRDSHRKTRDALPNLEKFVAEATVLTSTARVLGDPSQLPLVSVARSCLSALARSGFSLSWFERPPRTWVDTHPASSFQYPSLFPSPLAHLVFFQYPSEIRESVPWPTKRERTKVQKIRNSVRKKNCESGIRTAFARNSQHIGVLIGLPPSARWELAGDRMLDCFRSMDHRGLAHG